METVNKVIFVVYDGLGDRPIKEFGYKTPLEAANTPNFDAIAKKSLCGLSNALGRGVRPGSDVSHLAIFGYPMDKYYTGRGPIEVAGLGIKLQQGDIIVLMSDGLYELIPWKEIEEVLASGQDCQSMAYTIIEKVNQSGAEDKDNASVILVRWDGSGRRA